MGTHNNNHSLPKPSVDLIASTLYSLPTHHSIKQSNHLLIQQSINLSLNQHEELLRRPLPPCGRRRRRSSGLLLRRDLHHCQCPPVQGQHQRPPVQGHFQCPPVQGQRHHRRRLCIGYPSCQGLCLCLCERQP